MLNVFLWYIENLSIINQMENVYSNFIIICCIRKIYQINVNNLESYASLEVLLCTFYHKN